MQDTLSLILAAVMAAAPAAAADITVMSGGAPKEVLNELIPQFESATGHRVKVSYVLITALRQKIIDGETPDMVVMPTTAIDELVKLGNLREAGRGTFGTVRLVAIVKAGAARPDISTPDAFKAALLNARSVVYSRPGATPSGTHMAKVVADLKIADAVEKKAAYKPALEGGVQMVADGAADIGIYPASEVVHVQGVEQIGPLPDALQLSLIYAGAVTAANASPEAAASLMAFLSAPDKHAVWEKAGFIPAH